MRLLSILILLLLLQTVSSSFTAVCLCLRSLNEPKSRKNTPFFRDFLPSLRLTTTLHDNIQIYVAIDDDDSYWLRRRWALEKERVNVLIIDKASLNGRIPFNEITAYAFNHGAEYFVRVNDDTVFTSPGWVELGKNALKLFNPPNLGVVAPYDETRLQFKWFEQDMTHRTHLLIHPTYYPSDIKNIYVDYWITLVYSPSHAMQFKNWTVYHKNVESRYSSTAIPFDYFAKSVINGKKQIRHYIQTHFQTTLFKNILSYSFYGNNPRYTDGAIANAQLMPEFYPNWTMRVYIHDSVPTPILEKLKSYPHVEVCTPPLHDQLLNPMTWRFLVASDLLVTRYIVRDIDSRLSVREKNAVDEWIISMKPFHILHDHPFHIQPINGGLFGGTYDAFPQMETHLHNKKKPVVQKYDADQRFLETVVYPIVKDISLVHDAFHFTCGIYSNPRPFPSSRIGWEHVGSVFIDGKMRQDDVIALIQEIPPEPCQTTPVSLQEKKLDQTQTCFPHALGPIPARKGQIDEATSFSKSLTQLAKQDDIKTILEIGTWYGGGSTEAFVNGIKHKSHCLSNITHHCCESFILTFEIYPPAWNHARLYHQKNPVWLVQGTTVSVDQMLSVKDIPSKGEHFKLYYERDRAIMKKNTPQLEHYCKLIKPELVLIDGNEYTGWGEFEIVMAHCKPKYLALHDVGTLKTMKIESFLKKHPAKFNQLASGSDKADWAVYVVQPV